MKYESKVNPDKSTLISIKNCLHHKIIYMGGDALRNVIRYFGVPNLRPEL